MSTNDMPQCDNVIVARGRHAEWRRLLTTSAVVVGIKWFDFMLPEGKTAKRRDGSFGLRTLGRKDALRTGATDTIELRGVGQRSFLMMLVLGSQDGRLMMLTGPFCSRAAALPVQQNRQAHDTKSRKYPCHHQSSFHSGCKGTNIIRNNSNLSVYIIKLCTFL